MCNRLNEAVASSGLSPTAPELRMEERTTFRARATEPRGERFCTTVLDT